MNTLRSGFTTGSCAAAASKAAAIMLLSQKPLSSVKIETPSGVVLTLDIIDISIQKESVTCGIVKDAGDDPDVTNGIKLYATVSKSPDAIQIEGGVGIGRVTKKGLPISVGKAAINPVPLAMITSELQQIQMEYAYKGGFYVLLSVPNGEEVAKHTFNSRLGILGGISILGTTGIVEPMSEQAILDTIKLELNVFRENGVKSLIIAPGNYGFDFLQEHLGIDLNKAVKCSNFIGETIDYACALSFSDILLVGHVGKLVKLAGGIMNTHSAVADCRMEILAAHAALAGLSDVRPIMEATTTEQAFHLIGQAGVLDVVTQSLGEKIQFHLEYRTKNRIPIRFISFLGDKILLSTANEL